MDIDWIDIENEFGIEGIEIKRAKTVEKEISRHFYFLFLLTDKEESKGIIVSSIDNIRVLDFRY